MPGIAIRFAPELLFDFTGIRSDPYIPAPALGWAGQTLKGIAVIKWTYDLLAKLTKKFCTLQRNFKFQLASLISMIGFCSFFGYVYSSLSSYPGGPIRLKYYVHQDLSILATKLEGGDYFRVRQELDSLEPSEPIIDIERQYMKGLCSQAMGNYGEAIVDFQNVERNASDRDLIRAAQIGLFLSYVHQSKLWAQEYTFPSVTPDFDFAPRMGTFYKR